MTDLFSFSLPVWILFFTLTFGFMLLSPKYFKHSFGNIPKVKRRLVLILGSFLIIISVLGILAGGSVSLTVDSENPSILQIVTLIIVILGATYFFIVFKKSENHTNEIPDKGLLNILVSRFDLEELKDLCFDLKIDFDNLQGKAKKDKARELLNYCKRHNLIQELKEQVIKQRPDVTI